MKAVLKILSGLMVVVGLTAFGLIATCLAERNPLPTAVIGAAWERHANFIPYDGAPLWN
ncbi:hypothetical protein RZS28_15500 [Methylocapsa polymorpha]|uniref:Uncharacterized protein n=1 Tax=Methylocapsa polymorpha TaxID=3080828 RepID=A0ABZ0HS12_9HYPH|nr:hypothetical protein RZS28_15500 [Methylocapsa sp. RX1]